MSFLFGRRQTPDDMLRANQRALNRAMRELDRERSKLENQEQKVIADVKQMAKRGQMDAVRILARDLIRTRGRIKKFILMRANIQAVSLKITTLKSQNAMTQAMKGVSRTMLRMNQQLKIPQVTRIMQDFEKQSQMLEMKDEMISDVIDSALTADGDFDDEDAESDRLVEQVLDELGIELQSQLNSLPANHTATMESASITKQQMKPIAATSDADDDLMARLDALRRN
ncbi:hypothetical protein ACOME3_002758 [Neoechinorhynchus agilis]